MKGNRIHTHKRSPLLNMARPGTGKFHRKAAAAAGCPQCANMLHVENCPGCGRSCACHKGHEKRARWKGHLTFNMVVTSRNVLSSAEAHEALKPVLEAMRNVTVPHTTGSPNPRIADCYISIDTIQD